MWAVTVAISMALPVTTASAASLQLFVDCASGGTVVNGSRQKPFHDIASAVAAGRAQRSGYSDIKISVLPGTCNVSSTIVIDFPVRVQGSSVLNFDSDGRPVGTVQNGTDSRVIAADAIGANPVFAVEPPSGAQSVVGVTITNFSIVGTPSVTRGTQAATISVRNAQNLMISDLVVAAPAGKELASPTAGIDLTGTSGYLKKSYVKGVSACGICIAGGTSESPAVVNVIQNRSVANGAGGLLLAGTGVTGGDSLTAQINNNSFADNTTGAQGFGVRIIAIGSSLLELPNSAFLTAHLNGNSFANNRYQLIVDAGFPPRNKGPIPSTSCADEYPYLANMNIYLNSNAVTNTAITKSSGLVTTTRAQVWLAPNNPNGKSVLWQYLFGSSISIFDPELALTGASSQSPFLYDVPEADPFLNPTDGGSCAADWVNEALGDYVSYNGATLTGRNF